MFGAQMKAPETAPWGKFSIGYSFKTPCSAKTGYLVKYLLAMALSLYWPCVHGPSLEAAFMIVHFGKRCLEVLFLHDFSGSPTEELSMCSVISLFYAMVAWLFLKAGVHASPPLVLAGALTFALAQAGNYYHHLLLRNLRRDTSAGSPAGSAAVNEKKGKYAVPRGGLFDLVVCPHYLLEALAWAGAALCADSLLTWLVPFWVMSMLSGRSLATAKWYESYFGDEWPKGRKAIVPFVL